MAEGKRKVTVEIAGDTSRLSKSLKSSGNEMSKWGGRISKGAKFAALGFAGAAVTAGFALKGMVENGAKDEAGQRRLARALKNTTGARKGDIKSVEDWIYKTEVAKGVTDDELRPALQRLVQSSGSVKKGQKDLGIALDVSAGSGKSLAVVTAAMSKAQNGNLGALSKLGVKIKDVHGKTMTYKEVVKSMAATFKGQANDAANSFDGKINRLKITFDEAKETIGQFFIPILDKVASWFLDKGIPNLQKFSPLLSGAMDLFKKGGPIGEAFSKIMDGIHDAMDGIRKTFEKNRPQLELFFTRMKIIGVALAKVIGTQLKYSFKVLGKAIEVAIIVISKLVDWTPAILNDFIRPVVVGFIGLAQFIVTAADEAFGWVPGLGDKLDHARDAITKFKNDTDNQFKTWADHLSHQGEVAGGNLSKGLAKGIKANSKLPKAQAAALARQVAHQAGAARGDINAYASGTSSARRGIALVGEDGPELVRMRGGEQVIPAGATAGAIGGGGLTIVMPPGFMVGTAQQYAEYTVKALLAYQKAGGSLASLRTGG